eukprot:4180958-Amphidinium_carterae.1
MLSVSNKDSDHLLERCIKLGVWFLNPPFLASSPRAALLRRASRVADWCLLCHHVNTSTQS